MSFHATSERARRARHENRASSIRLASLRFAPGVRASCTRCGRVITETDLACAATIGDFDSVRTVNFHADCYRTWCRDQSHSSELHATDAELAEGLHE
jgi:hypothetical protein